MVVMVVVRPVERPRRRQGAVLVLAAAHARQAAARAAAHPRRCPAAGRPVARRLPRRAIGHGRAGRVGEARRDVRGCGARTAGPRRASARRAAAATSAAAVRGAVGRRLRPAGVRGRATRVVGGAGSRALQVGQARQHGAHARRGHVDRRAGRGGGGGCGGRRGHEAARRAFIRCRAMAGERGEGLVHLLGLLGRERAQLGAPARPQQLAGRRGLVEVGEEQQVLPARQGAPGARDPGRRGSVRSREGMRGVRAEQQRASRGSRRRLRVELGRPAVAGAAGAAFPSPGAAGRRRRRDGGRRRGPFSLGKGSRVAHVRARGPEALRQAPAAVSQGHPQSGAARS